MNETTVTTSQIANLFAGGQSKLNRVKYDIKALADESGDPLLGMIYELIEFSETGRPIGDWKAAESALRNFKRNY